MRAGVSTLEMDQKYSAEIQQKCAAPRTYQSLHCHLLGDSVPSHPLLSTGFCPFKDLLARGCALRVLGKDQIPIIDPRRQRPKTAEEAQSRNITTFYLWPNHHFLMQGLASAFSSASDLDTDIHISNKCISVCVQGAQCSHSRRLCVAM